VKAIYLVIGMAFTGLLASSSIAQQDNSKPLTSINRTFYCYDTDRLVKELLNTHKETPFLIGKTSDQVGTTMSLWVSTSSKAWTLLATKDDVSCVIGSGTDISLVPLPKGIGV
jgi:hypothetical protein